MSFRKRILVFVCGVCISLISSGASAALPMPGQERGFSVYEQKGGGWQKVGFLPYNEMFRQQGIRLGTEGKEVHLRLEKRGAGPGHVDFSRVNNLPPTAVRGSSDDIPLLKLTAKDFDVVHVYKERDFLELTFPSGGDLQVAARVEGEHVSEIPFRFPTSNAFTDITAASDFYTLSPGRVPQVVFSEETSPGTGHPWGMATASVLIRENSLHVRLNFESDNTLDGGVDYASLHLRTPQGIRTFTVSRDDRRWGKPSFVYTPGVPWQHKMYDFVIPLSEIPASRTMQIAMSAYGTAAMGGAYDAALAYGSQNREYLAAYYHAEPGNLFQVLTRRYGRDGSPIGTPFPVTVKDVSPKTEQDIAYDSTNDRFLVSWIQPDNSLDLVHRQLVSSANTLVGGVEKGVSPFGQRYPAAAYSSGSECFLVVWQQNKDAGPTETDILGNIVTTANAAGVNLQVCTETGFQHNPRVTYMPGSDTFLVVWGDRRNQAANLSDIYGRLVKPDGSLPGISTSVYAGPGGQSTPDVAHDPIKARSLVVWQDNRNDAVSGEDIHGQFLADGILANGDEFVISDAAGDQWGPRVAYAGNGLFLVTWQDRGPVPAELHGRFISSLGQMIGSEKVFKKLDDDIYSPVLAGDGDDALLALYGYIDIDTMAMELGTEAIASPFSGKIFLYLPAIMAE